MSRFIFTSKEIWKGKSVTRAFLNYRLQKETLQGRVIDIGGGKSADYISFMNRAEGIEFKTFDVKSGEKIDFEKDALPAKEDSYDTVMFLNVMEHIFNYQHIANEIVRIVKPGGKLIGFVPFLMWYHPDHRDFFRYTHEALEIIFRKSGVHDIHIEPIAHGPFTAAAQMTTQSLPRIFRIFVFAISYLTDKLFLSLRSHNKGKYALGYYFVICK